MANLPTQRDLFLAGRQEAVVLPTKFDRAIIDTDGSDVNVVMNVSASMGEEVAVFVQTQLNGLALGTARNEALDRRVFDLYQLPRKQATNAVATLRLTRSDTSTGFTIPAGSAFATTGGVTFVTANDVAFAVGIGGPLSVLATADQAGTAGNVGPETITQVIAALPDTTVQVTNLETAAGGNDRESDDQYQARARDFFVTARRGTLAAIESGGLNVPRVAQAVAAEYILADTGLPGYRVSLNITDPNGQANSAVANEVSRSLDEYRALGVPVLVIPAIPQYVDIIANGLAFTSGANTTSVLQQASNLILALVNALPPGGTLLRSEILRVLSSVNQLIVPDGALSEPAGDLVPSTGTVIRTTRDRIQLNA